jgi:signal transduction histidine kinase
LIEWLCGNLGLPLIEERSDGELTLNDAARDMLGVGNYASISAALGPLLGDEINAATLQAALQRARQGEPSELSLAEGLRAMVTPGDEGRACVVLAPRGSLDGLALQRRALATDRSARVSHELANALGAIAGWAKLAKEGARVDEALDLIEKSADNAWSAARAVLGEVSGQKSQRPAAAVIDFSEFTEEAGRLLVPKALKKGVAIQTNIAPGLQVAGDRSSAWAIVWNLASNAIEALSAGGSVSLHLCEVADKVRLCVADDGPGMSAEVRSRIFEPYFTTKRSGSGLGLGLVKQAVAALGGELEFESEPARGTRFVIEFPRSHAPLLNPKPLRAPDKRASGVFLADALDGKILVIDDDASLREMIATALQMRGAEVQVAASLSEAMQLRGPFKLVVVDYLLSDNQRGDAALAALRAAGMATVGLLVTGTEVPRQLTSGGEPDAVLRKPFELDELFERVAELTAPGRQRRSAAG